MELKQLFITFFAVPIFQMKGQSILKYSNNLGLKHSQKQEYRAFSRFLWLLSTKKYAQAVFCFLNATKKHVIVISILLAHRISFPHAFAR